MAVPASGMEAEPPASPASSAPQAWPLPVAAARSSDTVRSCVEGRRGFSASVLQCSGGAPLRCAPRPLGSVTQRGRWVPLGNAAVRFRYARGTPGSGAARRRGPRGGARRSARRPRRGAGPCARGQSRTRTQPPPPHTKIFRRVRAAAAHKDNRARARRASGARRSAQPRASAPPPLLPRGRGQWAPSLQRGRSRPRASAPQAGPAPAPEASGEMAPVARRSFERFSSRGKLRRPLHPLRPGIFGRGARASLGAAPAGQPWREE